MHRSLPLAIALSVLFAAFVMTPDPADAGRCGMINVGTPEKPKIIPDPSGCSTGGDR